MDEADPGDSRLIALARAAAAHAYAPYSGYHVGAAVEADDGRVFCAANVENASYGLSLCAEANAVAAAAVAGVRRLSRVAVVGYRADDPETPSLATPCGRCRQMINEFAEPGTPVLVAHRSGALALATTLGALLPHAFGPSSLRDG